MRHQLTLFTGRDDVLCHRVRIALSMKGAVYESVIVDPTNPPDELMQLNPYHSIPTLVEREIVLYAPCVVSEYIDDRYPHPPLMPADPLAKARLRLTTLRLEHDWVPLIYQINFGEPEQAEEARSKMTALLTSALPLFKASKFFLNPEFSLADCLMAAILWRLEALGVALPENSKPIEDYMFRIFKTPFFERSLTNDERKLRALPNAR